jgi:hypothetical protein
MPLNYSNRNKGTCHENFKLYLVAVVVSSNSSSSSNCLLTKPKFRYFIIGHELMGTDKGHENARCVFGILSDSVLKEIWTQQETSQCLWVCAQIFQETYASILYCRAYGDYIRRGLDCQLDLLDYESVTHL